MNPPNVNCGHCPEFLRDFFEVFYIYVIFQASKLVLSAKPANRVEELGMPSIVEGVK